MQRREAPEPWASAMRQRGITHGDRPSMTRLATKADVGVQTVINMMFGITRTEPEVITKVARALDRDVREVSAWVGQARTEAQPWVPPAEADLLTDRQRRALDQLIRTMVEPPVVTLPTGSGKTAGFLALQASEGQDVEPAPLRRVARRDSGRPPADG